MLLFSVICFINNNFCNFGLIKIHIMNLEARKLTIIEKFIHVQNDDIISQVENILANIKVNNSKNRILEPFTIDEFNSRIEKSMSDSKKGNLISNKDLKSEIEEWN